MAHWFKTTYCIGLSIHIYSLSLSLLINEPKYRNILVNINWVNKFIELIIHKIKCYSQQNTYDGRYMYQPLE